MNYFYFLNNKDIYGINGRFFGSTLSICDCVDYLKQIGVPEGTSMDLTFGGFNGCYVYANNTLIKTLPSCGYVPETCESIPNNKWAVGTCSCYYPNFNTIVNNAYINFASDLVSSMVSSGGQMIYQLQQSLGYNWNVPERILTLDANQITYMLPYSKIYGTGPMVPLPTIYVRIKKTCTGGLWSPWSEVKLQVISNYSQYPPCVILPSTQSPC